MISGHLSKFHGLPLFAIIILYSIYLSQLSLATFCNSEKFRKMPSVGHLESMGVFLGRAMRAMAAMPWAPSLPWGSKRVEEVALWVCRLAPKKNDLCWAEVQFFWVIYGNIPIVGVNIPIFLGNIPIVGVVSYHPLQHPVAATICVQIWASSDHHCVSDLNVTLWLWLTVRHGSHGP